MTLFWRRIGGAAGLALAVLLVPALGLGAPAAGGFSAQTGPGPAPWTAAPANDGGPLRFAVIGDRTGVARPGVFPQAMKQIGWLAPDFVIAVGDLIEGYSDDRAELNREWDQIGGWVGEAGAPFIYVPGNHDISNLLAQDVWTERHGRPWYAFAFKGALFIVLDTEDPPTPMTAEASKWFHGLVDQMNQDIDAGDKAVAEAFARRAAPGFERDVHIGDAQLAFVREALARHPNPRWTFVFFHKPAWNSDDANWPKIEGLLAGRPYTVFAGHLHYFSHIQRAGHDYIEMGTTGAIAHREGPGTMDHTMLVTLTPAGPKYANIRLNGLADIDGQTGQSHAH